LVYARGGCVGTDVFGEGALLFADTTDHTKDFVAGSEGSDSGADGFDSACHIETENGREWLIGMAALSGANYGVERIDPGGVDFHENLMRRGRGCG
jgi:hypothetical protein